MAVAWAEDAYAAVTDCTVEGHDVMLTVEEPRTAGRATRVRTDISFPALEEALARSGETSAWLVRDHLGDIHEVVDWTHFTVSIGAGTGHWNMLTPSGAAPIS